MKLIKSGFEILKPSGYTIDDIYKMIEIAGRTCYKSNDKITEDSAKKFVDMLIKSGHGAMLEHGTIYLKVNNYIGKYNNTNEQSELIRNIRYLCNKYENNKYSELSYSNDKHYICITTNLRVLVENDWLDDLQYLCEPTEYHKKRITVKWQLDRVTGESFLRHRVFSFARESTRYCNYSKDKFGNELTYIIPTWVDDIPDNTVLKDSLDVNNFVWKDTDFGKEVAVSKFTQNFLYNCIEIETKYIGLINNGYKPQQARQVLPFCISSPLVMTGTLDQWKGFFKLRCDSHAHPDAQYLAKSLLKELYKIYPEEFKEQYKQFIDNEK